MAFKLKFTFEAEVQFNHIKIHTPKKFKKILKTLALLEINPRHPGLRTHKYTSITGLHGEDIFEASVENNTPGAFRVFWHYNIGEKIITIVTIVKHP